MSALRSPSAHAPVWDNELLDTVLRKATAGARSTGLPNPRDLAADATADLYLKGCREPEKAAWKAGRYAALAAHRKAIRHVPLPEIPYLPPPPDDQLDPGPLLAALDDLPDDHRRAAVLVWLEGRSHVEAGKALGRPPHWVGRVLERVAEILRGRAILAGLAQ